MPRAGMSIRISPWAWKTGMPQSLFDGLKQRGHNVRYESQESVFGGAQLIQALSSGYVGASDHRKEGYVGGF